MLTINLKHSKTIGMKMYIEIRAYATDRVYSRTDVTGKTENEILSVIQQSEENLNTEDFYVSKFEYKTEQEKF